MKSQFANTFPWLTASRTLEIDGRGLPLPCVTLYVEETIVHHKSWRLQFTFFWRFVDQAARGTSFWLTWLYYLELKHPLDLFWLLRVLLGFSSMGGYRWEVHLLCQFCAQTLCQLWVDFQGEEIAVGYWQIRPLNPFIIYVSTVQYPGPSTVIVTSVTQLLYVFYYWSLKKALLSF